MSNKYKEEITAHLEQKYSESFSVNKIIRRIETAEADVVLARCFSEKYPDAFFDVLYHLSSDDIYKKDAIIAALKDKGYDVDEKKLFENEEKSDPYFEDNYTNIIKQHRFDDLCTVPENVKIITKINTFGYYPSLNDYQMPFEEYLQSIGNKIMTENYIFASGDADFNEEECITAAVNKLISKQVIFIIYTSSSIDECVKTYYQNYDFPYEAFEKDNNTVSIKIFEYNYGCKLS